MITPEICTPTSLTESQPTYDLKECAKAWWVKEKHQGTNFFVQWQNTKPTTEYVSEEALQGLWKYNQAVEAAWTEVCNMPSGTP